MTDPGHLDTPRLVLRRPRTEDLDELVALEREADVSEYLRGRGVDLSDIPARIEGRIAADADLPPRAFGWWVIAGKADDRFLGRGLLAAAWQGADPELGLYLRHAARGQGFATEAATALLDHAFRTLQLPRVIALLMNKEGAGRKLVMRLRFSRAGKAILYGTEADRYVINAGGWLPRRQ